MFNPRRSGQPQVARTFSMSRTASTATAPRASLVTREKDDRAGIDTLDADLAARLRVVVDELGGRGLPLPCIVKALLMEACEAMEARAAADSPRHLDPGLVEAE